MTNRQDVRSLISCPSTWVRAADAEKTNGAAGPDLGRCKRAGGGPLVPYRVLRAPAEAELGGVARTPGANKPVTYITRREYALDEDRKKKALDED